ncbi:MAG: lysophospholipid acyltransferase family protein [Myxococcota bacterium]|nr:lysophospholipid acyltransferase family protein [Myxococcota bacterium]
MVHRTFRGRAIWWVVGGLTRLITVILLRLRAGGARPLPRTGPYLLLANHTSMLDPWFVGHFTWRITHFMGSTSLFRNRFLGAFLRSLGTFPKEQFVPDRSAMKTLNVLYEEGQVIHLYPEGTRTWDGSPLPVLDGIGRLVKRIGARVVVGRVLTGHLAFPRWATYPRAVPVRVEYDPPMEFGPDETPGEITERIAQAMMIDPEKIQVPPFSFGFRLAHGLPDFLWACPACKEMDGLSVDPDRKNSVTCGKCSASWRVDLGQRLHPNTPDTPELSVRRAWLAIEEHLGLPPRDPGLESAGDGTVLVSAAPIDAFLMVRGGEPELLASGTARLTEEELTVGGEEGWSLSLDDLAASSMEFRSRLFLRIASTKALIHFAPQGESPLKWHHFLVSRTKRERTARAAATG